MAENQNIIEIPLSQKYVVIVDAIDGDLAEMRWVVGNGLKARNP